MAKDKPGRTFRELIREKPSAEERGRIDAFLAKAPDLPVAILLAAGLELQIEEHIVQGLKRKDEATIKLLFGGGGPLNSFASKIAFGFSMKFYDDLMRHNLKVVANIRNTFAHARRLITFEEPEIVLELGRIKLPSNRRLALYRDLKVAKTSVLKARERYMHLCNVLSIPLFVRSRRLLTRSAKYYRSQTERIEKQSLYALLAGAEFGDPPTEPPLW